ncbi:hypothetical protein [Clostridium merdae]|uniref:hypothetical protein n=1 Tax=Clostridium merdae TaxID=1958780 RepID=UPI000A26EA9B|nr:hypothetical protein [Clostridium merdae]
MKKKDTGTPTVATHILSATEEEVVNNRASFQAAIEMGLSRMNGFKTAVELDWAGNAENYRKFRKKIIL